MTAALEGGEWSAARPGHTLHPGKTRYPFYRRLGEPQGRSGWAGNLIPTRIWSRTVQPLVSCYTDWATWPTLKPIKYHYQNCLVWLLKIFLYIHFIVFLFTQPTPMSISVRYRKYGHWRWWKRICKSKNLLFFLWWRSDKRLWTGPKLSYAAVGLRQVSLALQCERLFLIII